jgi:hypothetical protein
MHRTRHSVLSVLSQLTEAQVYIRYAFPTAAVEHLVQLLCVVHLWGDLQPKDLPTSASDLVHLKGCDGPPC